MTPPRADQLPWLRPHARESGSSRAAPPSQPDSAEQSRLGRGETRGPSTTASPSSQGVRGHEVPLPGRDRHGGDGAGARVAPGCHRAGLEVRLDDGLLPKRRLVLVGRRARDRGGRRPPAVGRRDGPDRRPGRLGPGSVEGRADRCAMARSSASVSTRNSSAAWTGRPAPGPRLMSHAAIAGRGPMRRRQVDSGHSAGRSSSLASWWWAIDAACDPEDTDTGGSGRFRHAPNPCIGPATGQPVAANSRERAPAVVHRRPGGAASRAVGESGLVRKLPGTAVLRRREVVGVPAKGGWLGVRRRPRGMEAG